jgi:hypothetical protein
LCWVFYKENTLFSSGRPVQVVDVIVRTVRRTGKIRLRRMARLEEDKARRKVGKARPGRKGLGR